MDEDLSYERRLVPSGGDPAAQPVQSEGRIIIRRAGTLEFQSQDTTNYSLDPKGSVVRRERLVIARSMDGLWIKAVDGTFGTFEKRRPDEDFSATWCTPERALYSGIDTLPQPLSAKGATISRNDNGNYTLEIARSGGRVAFEMDPAKDFVPVKTSIFGASSISETPSSRIVCYDFAKAGEGIWLPSDYEVWTLWESRADGDIFLYEKWHVNEIAVNKPLNRSDFEVAFPPGTRIPDRFAQLQYCLAGEASLLKDLSGWGADTGSTSQELLVGRRPYFFGPLQALALLTGLVLVGAFSVLAYRYRVGWPSKRAKAE